LYTDAENKDILTDGNGPEKFTVMNKQKKKQTKVRDREREKQKERVGDIV
jgi:hypothetical protein